MIIAFYSNRNSDTLFVFILFAVRRDKFVLYVQFCFISCKESKLVPFIALFIYCELRVRSLAVFRVTLVNIIKLIITSCNSIVQFLQRKLTTYIESTVCQTYWHRTIKSKAAMFDTHTHARAHMPVCLLTVLLLDILNLY